MSDTEEIAKLVDGAYKNILEKFNPSARQLVSAGKAYLKALHGAVSSSKAYIDALNKLARHAHHGTWGGCADIGTALMQLVEVQKEIESQQMNILKAFYVDFLVPLESNIDKDTKVVACEQKRFLQQHKCLQESYLKAAATVKKQKKKNRTTRCSNIDKEIKTLQTLDEEKMKLDCFCERSLKQAIIQERRRFGFVLERQCSLTKHNMVHYSQGQNLLLHRLEEWEGVAKGRESLPESIDKLFPPSDDFRKCPEYSAPGVLMCDSTLCLSGGGTLRKTRSIDTSCMDLREAPSLPFPGSLFRAKSDFNIASSSTSLVSNDYNVMQHRLPPRPKSLVADDSLLQRWKVRAMYSYLSSGEHQLSFHEGDVICLIGARNKGWQYGENLRNRRCGWFPIAYTEPLLDDIDSDGFDKSFDSPSYGVELHHPYQKTAVTRSKTAPSIHTYDCGPDSSYASAASSPLSTDSSLPPAPTIQRPFSTFVDSNSRKYESLQTQQLRFGPKYVYATAGGANCAPAATAAPDTVMTSEQQLTRRTVPPSSLHGSNDSGFCNDGSNNNNNTNNNAIKHPSHYHSIGEPGQLPDQDDMKPKDNMFSSVKLRRVVTNDRSAPMIT